MNQSFEKNTIFMLFKNIVNILSTFFIFSYLTRIFTLEALGINAFAYNITFYFLLLSGLGINSYSIREGSRMRDSDDINLFSSQIFSINLLSTLFSFILFIVLFIFFWRAYYILFIYSFLLFSKLLSLEWLYSLLKKFKIISIINIISNLILLLTVFLFVKNTNHVTLYVYLFVLINFIQSLIMFIYIRRFIHLNFTMNLGIKKHFRPIMIIFITTITGAIYLNLDISIIGFFGSLTEVGYYSLSIRIINLFKGIISILFIVSLPTMSNLVKANFSEYLMNLKKILNWLLIILIPIFVFLIVKPDFFIQILTGNSIDISNKLLSLLAFSLFFSALAGFYSQTILLPFKKENFLMVVSIFISLISLLINIILFPKISIFAPVLALLISEIFAFLLTFIFSIRILGKSNLNLSLFKSLYGIPIIILVILIFDYLFIDTLLFDTISLFLSFLMYIFFQFVIKNELIIQNYSFLKFFLKKKITKI